MLHPQRQCTLITFDRVGADIAVAAYGLGPPTRKEASVTRHIR
jgi:hypothetical protein